ncbi:ankyrin unc44 [Colletotrichum musicola]|uniref:Ankyrin unc44 n=1 Tax=Colletotrichum musicola TaxID=2175873 RepID=A0A8H6MNM1_9PEZI|nr:ankyrin unc44 [Colletotrichum musicola]
MIIPNLELVYPHNPNLAPPRWRPLVNLICVHDIGGSPTTTWHHDESGKMWISDPEFLGGFRDTARVWTYGFNSDPAVNMAPASIAFHADELLAMILARYSMGGGGPTIFVAHGIGGVIAVILALNCIEYFNIRDAIAGIVFLDTVHHQTDSEGVLTSVKTIAALCLQKGSSKPSSDETRQYADAIREVNRSFLETLPPEIDMLNFVAARRVKISLDGTESHKVLIGGTEKASGVVESTKPDLHDRLRPLPTGKISFAFGRDVSSAVRAYCGDDGQGLLRLIKEGLLSTTSLDIGKAAQFEVLIPRSRCTDKARSTKNVSADEAAAPGRTELDLFSVVVGQKGRRLIQSLGSWDDIHMGHDVNPMPGTCAWIQNHSFFVEWSKSNATEDFYLYGSAGCGKTHLAKSVVNHLGWTDGRQTDDIVLPFFCNVSATGNKRPPVLEYVVKSIFGLRPLWYDGLGPRYQHPDAGGKLTMASLFNVLRELMARPQMAQGRPKMTKVFLIIDGIDECDTGFTRELLQLVSSLVHHPSAGSSPPPPVGMGPPLPPNQVYPRETVKFKFFFTYTPNEIMSLASVGATRVRMKDEDIRNDIGKYVDKAVEDMSTVKSNKDPPGVVASAIKKNADSFFLFAKYAMEDAISTDKEREYGYSMSRRPLPCPEKLGQYYDYDLLPLFQSVANEKYALSALMVILQAQGFVSGLMIRDALVCMHEDPQLKFIDIQSILMHRCPRLLKAGEDFQVHPIHPSLHVHFRSHISEEEQNVNMASLCLKYLSQPTFGDGFTLKDLAKKHPFYMYAAFNWQQHVLLSGDIRLKLVPRLRDFFSSASYTTWCEYAEGPFDRPYVIIPPVIALVDANASDMAGLVEQDVMYEANLEIYPWKNSIWGWLCGVKWKMNRKMPKLAKFIDSFRSQDHHFATDPFGLSPLMHAAKFPSGMPEMVSYFAQWPSTINRRDPVIGATALMFFCRHIRSSDPILIAKIVSTLVDVGAGVNISTFRGETPLWLACNNGNPMVAQELLRAGADPNISDKDGSTPLHQTIRGSGPGAFEITRELIFYGADLDIKFAHYDMQSPLTACIVDMQFDVFVLLVENMENINQIDDGGFGAVHFLVQPKYSDWLPHLLSRPDLDLELLTDSVAKNGSPARQTALSFAIAEENFSAVKMLLEAGASPCRHPKSTDRTPLYIAVDFAKTGREDSSEDGKDRTGNLDIAELLLAYQTPINVIDHHVKFPKSALMKAVSRGKYSMVELLLKHGADPTLEEAYDLPSSLIAAVEKGDVDILKLLLGNSIPPTIDYVPKDYNHILVEAMNKDIELVQILLDHGADTKRFLSPGDSRTPLQSAAQEGNLALCKILVEREPGLVNYQNEQGLVCETPLNIAAREGHIEVVRYLLEIGAEPDLPSFHYRETPLWSACSRGRFKIAKLVHEKAPHTTNTPSYDGETPLIVACAAGALNLVKFLLQNGADMTSRCSTYESCVAKAFSRNGAPAYKIVQVLIEQGLGVDDVVSSLGYSVLGEACRRGDVPTVRLLLEKGADPGKGQRGPGRDEAGACWKSAARVAVHHRKVETLKVLLAHPKAGDFIGSADYYGETILHATAALTRTGEFAAEVQKACERIEAETGVNHFSEMLRTKSFKLKTPLDVVLGRNHEPVTGRALDNVDEIISRYISELVAAPKRTAHGHHHLIRDLARLLLGRHGHDEQAARLVQTYIVEEWIKEKEEQFEETVYCGYYCDECDGEEVGSGEEVTLYFCRYCDFNIARCCFEGYKGVHRLVAVPVVVERRILDLNSPDFMGVLEELRRWFIKGKARAEESPVLDIFEADPESEATTLSLAFLHALGYLEFRRRAWSAYLPLSPKISRRIEPWDWLIGDERRGFQEWVWRGEMYPWRLRAELEYFVEGGRRTAYRDLEVVKMELVLVDVGRLFRGPRVPVMRDVEVRPRVVVERRREGVDAFSDDEDETFD